MSVLEIEAIVLLAIFGFPILILLLGGLLWVLLEITGYFDALDDENTYS